MEQRLIPIMKVDRDMQTCKAVIHARENQRHIQGRLGNGNGHRRRDFLENEDDEEWLQDQLHRFEPLQEQELLMRIDDRTEHHRREAHSDIEQQQQKHLPRLRELSRRHTTPENRIEIPVANEPDQQRQQCRRSIPIERDRQDILHALLVLQGLVLRIEARHRSRQAKVHDAEIRNQGTDQLVEPVFLFPDKMQQDRNIEKAHDRMERNIQIAE